MPSFATLRSFECAARHESFTLASEELHLTQSAVSRQIKELESSTGIKLFRRVGRQVVLTEAGQRLADDLSVDLERVRQTMARAVLAGNEKTVLRIATLPTFANRWLIPRLPNFSELYPSIEISMTTRLDMFSLAEERIDLAIHFGTSDWPGAQTTKLFDEEMIAVSSPIFRDRYAIDDLEALQNVPLLNLDSRPNAWRDWFQSKGTSAGGIYSGKQFDQFSMIIAAADASLGVALLPAYLIEKELENGSLVQLDSEPLVTENDYFVVAPAGAVNPQTSAFVKWIKSEAQLSLHAARSENR